MNVHMLKAGASCLHNGERHPFLIDLRNAIELARRGSDVIAQMLEHQLGYIRYSELDDNAQQIEEPLYLQNYAA